MSKLKLKKRSFKSANSRIKLIISLMNTMRIRVFHLKRRRLQK